MEESGCDITMLRLGGAKTILLDDPASAFLIEEGSVDLFAVEMRDGAPAGPRRHLVRLARGQALFGLACGDTPGNRISVLASGGTGATLSPVQLEELRSADDIEERGRVVALLNGWVESISRGLRPAVSPKLFDREVTAGVELPVAGGQQVRAERDVLWVNHRQGNSRFCGDPAHGAIGGEGYFPLSSGAWLQAEDEVRLFALSTDEWLREDPEWRALEGFHRFALHSVRLGIERSLQDETARFVAKRQAARRQFAHSLDHLATVLDQETTHAGTLRQDNGLLEVCRLVGKRSAIDIVTPPPHAGASKRHDPLEAIAQASRIRTRRVVLREGWWRQDNGPLVGYLEEGRPVALLPRSATRYDLHDPVEGSVRGVTDDVAAQLGPFAFILYRSLPARPLKAWDLYRFAAHGQGRDRFMVLLMGASAGLLSLATPLATGALFERIIPAAQMGQLFMMVLALIVAAMATAVFNFTRSIAVLRYEGRADQHLQSAVWDRLLSLPVPFFRNYASGDLAQRVMAINSIRETISGTAVSSILSGVFSVFSLALLFYYSFKMALLALLLGLIALAVATGGGYFQLRYQKQLMAIQGQIAGMNLELIGGIAKFRAAAAESRAFARWSERFALQRRVGCRSRSVGNIVATFNGIFPVLSSTAIFAGMLLLSREGSLSIATFLAFNAAFANFSGSLVSLGSSALSILGIVPLYQRCKPILQAVPESEATRSDPGELIGEIEVSRVSFRYAPDGPLTLDDVSIHIRPGEFVALVGSSGSGKSTLLRLLLGFDTPISGGVYYDGQDLAGLDLRAVRQQTGTVLQNGQVMSGDIFTNIVGSSLLTIDDAWEAARMAGLDKDVEAMPMGMHTVVSQGGGTFSGGQRQRLLIARALAHKPRILFFDEATSALDNKTQAVVNESIERLRTTRVVIAHRLSTIMHADAIYVLDHGKVVQSGTYEELISQEGLFAELAKRQTA